MYKFEFVVKKIAYVLLLSYFVSRVIISSWNYNLKEVQCIHQTMVITLEYQI